MEKDGDDQAAKDNPERRHYNIVRVERIAQGTTVPPDSTQQDGPEAEAESKKEGEEIEPDGGSKTMLDVLMYVCGSLVIIGGLLLGYLGVSGGITNQRILALCILYFTLFFVLTGGFLFFLQRLLTQQSGGAFLEVTSVKIFRARINDLAETSEPGRLMAHARIIGENAELQVGDTPVPEVVITNTGSNMAHKVRGIILVSLGPMIGENPDYKGTPMYPLQSVTDLAKGGFVIYNSPWAGVLTAQDLQEINEFRKYIVVYGYVTYLDADKLRTTKFCYLYNPRLYRLSQCPTHNSLE
ncbi:MAG TPA: hypothetical protein VJ875_23885 [Pyrinomonadaceae bacterium]|nr:hypothetical protein [Pyrinomonadaceae bacterium]